MADTIPATHTQRKAEDEAYQFGYVCGNKGLASSDNPYDISTEWYEWSAWNTGWGVGVEKYLK